jgi:hypothetical protein
LGMPTFGRMGQNRANHPHLADGSDEFCQMNGEIVSNVNVKDSPPSEIV